MANSTRNETIMAEQPLYHQFIGHWTLLAESCVYEQGNAPTAGSYCIAEGEGGLLFTMRWTGAEGEQHDHSFTAPADGECHPFNGGALADALSVTAKSAQELNSAAFKDGKELMLAMRTLSSDGLFMDVKQSVRLPDLTEPSNFSRYKRQ